MVQGIDGSRVKGLKCRQFVESEFQGKPTTVGSRVQGRLIDNRFKSSKERASTQE